MFKIANQIAPHYDVLGTYELTQLGSGFGGKMLTSEIVNNALEYYIGEVYTLLGDVYSYQMNFEKAIDYYEKQNTARNTIVNNPNNKQKYYGDFIVYNLDIYSFDRQNQVNALKLMKDIYIGL